MLQENEKKIEQNERMLQENERILESNIRINNELNYSINERLFDSFQENINNDEIIKKLEEIEFNEQFKNKKENKCTICLEISQLVIKSVIYLAFIFFILLVLKNG